MTGDKLRGGIESISLPSNNLIVLNGKYFAAGGLSLCMARYSNRDTHAPPFAHLKPICRQR